MKRHLITCLALLALLVVLTPVVDSATDVPELMVSPSIVPIDLNYGGAELVARGPCSDGAAIVVKVTSPATSVGLSKKGKVFGLFWMTTEKALVENMPVLYSVYSSAPLSDVLDAADQAQLGIDGDFTAVAKQAKVVTADGHGNALPASEASAFIQGLRDLRVKDGLYRVDQGGVVVADGSWQAALTLPSMAPPGAYEVEVYTVQDKHLLAVDNLHFTVQKSGLVASLGSMANQNSFVYGLMAVLCAVAGGLIVGRIFKGGGH